MDVLFSLRSLRKTLRSLREMSGALAVMTVGMQ